MKVRLITVLCFLFTFYNGYSKVNFSGDKFNLKIGYAHYPWMGDVQKPSSFMTSNFTPLGYIESNYNYSDCFDFGVYLGFTFYEHAEFTFYENPDNEEIRVPKSASLSFKPLFTYGVNMHFQILPLILKQKCSFFDLYVTSKLGGIHFSERNTEIVFVERTRWNYGFYGGLAIYPFDSWGFFYEYGYGNYEKNRAGINIQLKNGK